MKKLWSLVTIILLALCLLGCRDKKANDEDEAQMAYEDGDTIYEEECIEVIEEVDEFTVNI